MKLSNALFIGKNDITSSRLKLLLTQYFNILNNLNPESCQAVFACYEHFEQSSEAQSFLKDVPKETAKIVILKEHHCPKKLSVLDEKGFDYYLAPPFSLEQIEELCRFLTSFQLN